MQALLRREHNQVLLTPVGLTPESVRLLGFVIALSTRISASPAAASCTEYFAEFQGAL